MSKRGCSSLSAFRLSEALALNLLFNGSVLTQADDPLSQFIAEHAAEFMAMAAAHEES